MLKACVVASEVAERAEDSGDKLSSEYNTLSLRLPLPFLDLLGKCC